MFAMRHKNIADASLTLAVDTTATRMRNVNQRVTMQRSATVLVTGAAGFIGSHLVDLLLSEGWNVVGLDNFDTGYDPALKRRNIALHLAHPSYQLVEADVRNLGELQERLPDDIRIVVHMAAGAVGASMVQQPLDAAAVNFQGTLNLLELCRTRRIRQFILASCGGVYGVAADLPWTEDTIPIPVNPLDAARLAAEQLGHCYSRLYAMQFVSVRLFNVYGPREQPGSMLTLLCDALVAGRFLAIPGDPHGRRDFTYVGDAVEALRLAMSFGATPSAVFNIGSGESSSMIELVRTLESITAMRASIATVARPAGELLDCWADVGKARRALGYAPRVLLREGLTRFLDWYFASRPTRIS
jgi:UDP-glucuronate 4-epimerase